MLTCARLMATSHQEIQGLYEATVSIMETGEQPLASVQNNPLRHPPINISRIRACQLVIQTL